jgi:16S rRNA (uracil1498-N3)-methyltransferase
MRLTRCYTPTPLHTGDIAWLPLEASNHLTRVLRSRPGQSLTLFDGRGGEYQAQILELARRGVRVQVQRHESIERESPLCITLLQSLARAERMDLIVQKATELGVAAIVALRSERSLVRLEAEALEKRCERWRAIAVAACEQCGRNRVPTVTAMADLAAACAQSAAGGHRLMLDPAAPGSLPAPLDTARAINLLIGPEGGFTEGEVTLARSLGFIPCRLGPRVLRAETAPLAALAAMQALAGDLCL